MNTRRFAFAALFLLLSLLAGPAFGAGRGFLLHLPGVAGPLTVDRWLLAGLRWGGVEADEEIYDWTCGEPGILALRAYARNHEQAKIVADKIVERFRADPSVPIFLTAHSGGTAVAVWALELLPEDVQVETVLLLAPALSPEYDLSAALRRVRGQAYAFSSPHDYLVLGSGTELFGTMDGVKTRAAGCVGFRRPVGADEEQYRKLVAMPYLEKWLEYGNSGDHIGVMRPRFVQAVLAPLVAGEGAVEPVDETTDAHR